MQQRGQQNPTSEARSTVNTNAVSSEQHKRASLLHNHAEPRKPRVGSQYQAALPKCHSKEQ